MISVIIPTYNCNEYISDAISSVLRQTYTDYEIIVVDDGSTDRTQDVIEKRFPRDEFPTIRYHYIPHQGTSAARNYGIREAHGEYIAFLDADDLWLPDKLKKQIKLFKDDSELMLVFTESRGFDGHGLKKKSFSKRERLMKGDIIRNIFIYSNVVTPTVMVRKRVFEEIGFFEEKLKVGEDDNLWLRIALKFKIALIDEVLVYYRIRNESITSSNDNFFNGVNEHIDLIKNKYPELRDHIGRLAVRKKKSENYFIRGYTFFSDKQMRLARRYLLESFAILPRIKSLLYFLSTFIPEKSIERIKTIKRKYNISGFR